MEQLLVLFLLLLGLLQPFFLQAIPADPALTAPYHLACDLHSQEVHGNEELFCTLEKFVKFIFGVDQSAHVQVERDRVTGVHVPLAKREDQLEELGANLELEADQVGDFLAGRELLSRRQLQFSLNETDPGGFRVDFLKNTAAKHQYLV